MLKARPKASPRPTARPPYPDDSSQTAIAVGNPVTTLQMIWMPTYITWNIWFGTSMTGPPNYTLTMTQGQTYTYTQEFSGNRFAGAVNICQGTSGLPCGRTADLLAGGQVMSVLAVS